MYKICRFSKPTSGIIKNTLPVANNSEKNSSSSPNNNFNFNNQQINELIQNNNEVWFKFLSKTKPGDLILMKEILPGSTYKSTEFLNFWLERISRSFNLVTDFDLVWKLLEYMVQHEIPLHKKPIDSFTLYQDII
ncbi:hypothetical protein DICPUDRAFT_148617 [Dictyostelium purpureum]|uniref:Uncharacterized protein n=1 Tax=Dictyostelium purpureum TaxID=5786 RepID=F0ZBK6_DICPU|nr:uncharacterized protein DICPUDRAFT_148617 [Dictyostelium purpureum]EGC38683.1 hypothetical protein DICPUDRAFT_148617 [Dictyostelium purpureum]|eukprot:XP_003284779.1 hypothetical protein DICPUDRAFT_148617 [Dictyostelium purpureum]